MRKPTLGRRTAARLATIAMCAALPVLTTAGPALALKHDDGDATHYPSLGAGLTILYYVVIPLGAFLVIAGLAVLPSTLRRPRYRPGKPWEHGSKWFGAPGDGDATADSANAADAGARGGASAEW